MSEIIGYKAKTQALESRLAEAEEVIEFYGDKKNWENVEVEHYKEAVVLEDCGYLDVNKLYTDAIRYGGKTARKWLANREEENK